MFAPEDVPFFIWLQTIVVKLKRTNRNEHKDTRTKVKTLETVKNCKSYYGLKCLPIFFKFRSPKNLGQIIKSKNVTTKVTSSISNAFRVFMGIPQGFFKHFLPPVNGGKKLNSN